MATALPSTSKGVISDDLDFAYACANDWHHQQKNINTKEVGVGIRLGVENKVQEEEGLSSSERNVVCNIPGSDLDKVLAESGTEIIFGEAKVSIKPDFFIESRSESGRNSVSGESVTYDPRKLPIGSTPEYLKMLKALPDKMESLVPVFTRKELNKPSNVYCNYPRAIIDYKSVENLMVPIVSNGAVKKLICKEGRDEKLAAGDNVLINYYIYVEGCSHCVESNKRRRKPHSFVLGKNKRGGLPVIDLGTLTMRVKEVAVFLATPEYGYGKFGCEDLSIPPNKRVLCIIEVLSRLASPLDSSSIINMVSAERKLLRFEEIYDFALKRKNDANKDFKKEKNARAMRKYLQAVACLQDASPKDDSQQQLKNELLHLLFTNLARCGFRTRQMQLVIDFSLKSTDLPISEKEKGLDYFRCARAYYCEKKWTKAKDYIKMALPHLQGLDEGKDAQELLKHIQFELEKVGGSTDSELPKTLQQQAKPKRIKSLTFYRGFLPRRMSLSDSSPK